MTYLKLFQRISSLALALLIVAACRTGPPAQPTPITASQPSTYTPSPEQLTRTPGLTATPTFTPAPLTSTPQAQPLELTLTSPPPLAPSPPGDPTALPLPPPSAKAQAHQAGALVEIEVQPDTASTGELITLTGRPTNLGLPQYTLYLRDEPAVIIRYDGELIFQGFTGEVVEFVSASASQTQAEFKLRAAKPGTVEAIISASGEVRLDTGGSMPVFSWSSVSSPGVPLTVVAQSLPDSPSEGSDQNWQLYSNKKYGYSLRYPATWELSDRLTYPEVEESDYFAISSTGVEFLYLNLAVDDYPYSPNQRHCTELAHCVDLYHQLRNSGPGWQLINREVIEQFGTSVLHQTIKRPGDGWLHRQTFFFKNGHFYRLEFITKLDNATQDGQTYEDIIATLSFDPS